MRSIVFSPRAESDLIEISDFIARDKPPAVEKLINRIEQTVAKLAELPGIGHRRPDVSDPRYLFFTVRPLVLAYRYDASTLIVIRILHGARDIREALKHD